MSWIKRLTGGLKKTSSKLSEGVTKIFTHKKLDEETLESLEELLISSDMGVKFASDFVTSLSKKKFGKEVTEEEIKDFLASEIEQSLHGLTKPLAITKSPHVILMCGVNGNGKTTTAGKFASKLKAEGKSVMLVACDTFRAAAVEQLEVWANKTNTVFVSGANQADPASIAYKGVFQAKEEAIDVVIIDTAGRLHNKKNLMDELDKIIKVIKKIDPSAPHEITLVIDATTGQNALSQVQSFKEIAEISSLVITKLDGTAKGGILVAIADKFKLPVLAIGVGESVEDLGEFDAKNYAKSILDLN